MKQTDLVKELEQVISGDPWYGSPLSKILEGVDPHVVFFRIGNSHSIAEILLHMIAWTEETQSRLAGNEASQPLRGDWPETDSYSWLELIGLFLLANEHLIHLINQMDEQLLSEPVRDMRNPALGTGVNYEELIRGLIKHHIYHSGQIAILANNISASK
ncbi:MAG: DinB family protein [Pedobacter sp.]|jgi:uncharacterized damage-inducible protein DinB